MSETSGAAPSPSAGAPNDAGGVDASPIPRLAMVICTYKRQKLLGGLFGSIARLESAPWRVVVVDNEDSTETSRMCEELEGRLTSLWGEAEPDAEGGRRHVEYAPQEENGGGAGGFSAGTRRAWELGAEWFWLMDDDVTCEPDAIARLAKWTARFDVVQAARLDYDGGAFFWQYRYFTTLGIPNPLANPDLGPSGFRPTNQLCFEGGLFSRRVVDKIGFPDARYFIYGDDACYGYVASRHFDAAVVGDVILRRARDITSWEINGVRQLNSTSDTNRYYIMRNRGHTARYLKEYGQYHRFLYGVGTFATLCKELIRLAAVDRTFKTGVPALVRGMRDARKIYRDPSWRPVAAPGSR